MTKCNSLCLLLLSVHFIFILYLSCCSSNNTNNVTELVNEVCARTSNYTFCIESLYSDPHTSQYDIYGLANVAFNLAYTNATLTREYISELQENDETSTIDQLMSLQKCAQKYEEAVTTIANAIFDLDSDTFFELAELAGVASHDAEDCQDNIKRAHYYDSQLEFMNDAMKGLCDICVAISNLFTGAVTF